MHSVNNIKGADLFCYCISGSQAGCMQQVELTPPEGKARHFRSSSCTAGWQRYGRCCVSRRYKGRGEG